MSGGGGSVEVLWAEPSYWTHGVTQSLVEGWGWGSEVIFLTRGMCGIPAPADYLYRWTGVCRLSPVVFSGSSHRDDWTQIWTQWFQLTRIRLFVVIWSMQNFFVYNTKLVKIFLFILSLVCFHPTPVLCFITHSCSLSSHKATVHKTFCFWATLWLYQNLFVLVLEFNFCCSVI